MLIYSYIQHIKVERLLGEGYTFFAPTNKAIERLLPQDTVDPFYIDSNFRTNVFLHHFATQRLTPKFFNDISQNKLVSEMLVMGDLESIDLSRPNANDQGISLQVLQV